MANNFIMGWNPVWFFLDVTGMPAVGATMGTFYADNHATPRPVYANPDGTGAYPNPVDLDTVGQAPIYFDIPTDNDDHGYYLVINDADGNLIKTVDDYNPGYSAGGGGGTTINSDRNYLINEQFRFNYGTQTGTNLGAPNALVVAQGGWSYYKNGTGSQEDIEFPLFALSDNIPEGTPTNYISLKNNDIGANETFRYFQFFIPDVRAFSQQQVIGQFAGRSLSNSTVSIVITQFFGTGGTPSTSVDTLLGGSPLQLTGSWVNDYSRTGTLPSVGGFSLGTNGDDGVYFRIGLPTNTTFDIDLVNLQFRMGNTVIPFPVYSFNLDRMETMGSQIPAPANGTAGADLNKVLKATLFGLSWGVIFPAGITFPWLGSKVSIPNGFTYCDGTRYDPTSTFSDGVSCSGLNTVLGITFGNGLDYMFSYILPAATNILRVVNNSPKDVTPAANGSSSPAFTYSVVVAGVDNGYGLIKTFYSTTGNYIWIWSDVNKTVYEASNPANAAGVITPYASATIKAQGLYYLDFTGITPSTLNNKYFLFQGTGTTTYMVWYDYNSTGVVPVPGFAVTPIEVDIATTDVLNDVMIKTLSKIRGSEYTQITMGAASTITSGNYFTIESLGVMLAVWYQKDGTGTAPSVPGYTLCEVDIVTADTAALVVSKTLTAINERFFAVPDARGAAIVGLPDGSGIDPGVLNRFSPNPTISGDNIGTYQFDQNRDHSHRANNYQGQYPAGSGSNPEQGPAQNSPWDTANISGFEGQSRSTPYNLAAYWIISH